MNKLDKQYTDLLQDILDNGVTKQDRTGTGTISVFGRTIRHKMSEGFPLLTTKRIKFDLIVTELLWFLRGDTNIKFLVDNGCHIWDGDGYKNFVNIIERSRPKDSSRPILSQEEFINKIKTDDEFAERWGSLGPVYGKQWRKWGEEKQMDLDTSTVLRVENGIEKHPYKEFISKQGIDQIANLIRDLKTNPDSRRLMVSAWNVGELDSMVLPPCHYGFQVYTRELSGGERYTIARQYGLCPKYSNIGLENCTEEEHYDKYNVPKRAISLMWNQRSVDTFLGLPFNIASYGLLLEIIAKEVNMVPDELIGNLGDTHLYLNHIEQAKEQIGRELSLEERNEWHLVNRCGGNKRDCKTDWKDFELDQQDVPKRTKEPFSLPTLNIKLHFNNEPSFVPEHWLADDFEIVNYKSHSPIKAPLSN